MKILGAIVKVGASENEFWEVLLKKMVVLDDEFDSQVEGK